jgi:beta-lactam-binding protein with PASTA domain
MQFLQIINFNFMQAIDQLLKKPLWVNILIGIGSFLAVIIIFFFSLGWLTGNGITEKVPNVIGLEASVAQKNLRNLGFNVVLQDSIYVDTLARNSVLRQTPEVDEVVKKGRTVYLTINRVLAPQIEMPNLIGFSLQSAETFLKVLGLRVGSITMVPDRNKNVIIDQILNGNSINPGTKISSGSIINLTVGDGGMNANIEVPDLIGLTVGMAKEKLVGMGLLIGSYSSNINIQDTAKSYIIGQNPNPYSMQLDSLGMPLKNKINAGGIINIVIDKVAPVHAQTDSIK